MTDDNDGRMRFLCRVGRSSDAMAILRSACHLVWDVIDAVGGVYFGRKFLFPMHAY